MSFCPDRSMPTACEIGDGVSMKPLYTERRAPTNSPPTDILNLNLLRDINTDEVEGEETGFADLVIPPDYKDLVEALVRNHSRGTRPTSGEAEKDHQVDVVKGKGNLRLRITQCNNRALTSSPSLQAKELSSFFTECLA